ncbi:TRAP transporter small permease subunit [Candidatus Pelagibacter sp.]|nr:TRAP transporter small permease subunit [Candidatus Pelagibacter sp.]
MINLIQKYFNQSSKIIAATLLAALFVTFLLQIFSRYVLNSPFGWTLELCRILWVWIVFFCCAFLVQEKDHVKFNLIYSASSNKSKFIMSIVSCLAIVAIMGWALLPTMDYIDWMKMRKTSTVRLPITGEKIKLSYVFSIYGIFMISLIVHYIWKLKKIIQKGPENSDQNKLRSVIKY